MSTIDAIRREHEIECPMCHYDITSALCSVAALLAEVDRLTVERDVSRYTVDGLMERLTKTQNQRNKAWDAIREHRDDEKYRHIAYTPGDMKSVADERLWSVLDDSTNDEERT